MLHGRRILLGVTGGVAAFKAAYLCRRLLERGAQVKVVMTPSAVEFIGPRTFTALTGEEPLVDLFDRGQVSPHTELARWTEAIIVAPCTANTLAKLALGISGDALSTTVAATDAPLFVAPAMHTEMWQAASTQSNITLLRDRGVTILGPTVGELAGGDVGEGRMLEPDELVDRLEEGLRGPLSGLDVLVSAGGTREALDPVRYIGNRSSGKMGNAVAAVARQLGAEVTLVTTASTAPEGVVVIPVESAEEMAAAVWDRAAGADVAVLTAAVADYRPSEPASHKLRRAEGPPVIDLEPTPDILAGVARMPGRPFLVGFAAEVGSLDGAIEKARGKGVDLLVANDVARAGSGFETDTNQVALISPDGSLEELPLLDKIEVANRIWARVISMLGPAPTDA